MSTIPEVTTAVYTPTSALTTTTFYRRVAISTYGGKQCEEYSNVIEVKVGLIHQYQLYKSKEQQLVHQQP